jgi:hypothetical protein
MAFTVPMAVVSFFQPLSGPKYNIWASIYFAFVPLLVSFPIVLAASSIIGLPADYLLRRHLLARTQAYVITGIIAGGLLSLAALVAIGVQGESLWICSWGAFSGAMAGLTWSRSITQPVKSRP